MALTAESPDASPSGQMDPAMAAGLTELFLATKDDLLPSVGKETAFLLDFDQRSRQWHPMAPPSADALPIPPLHLFMSSLTPNDIAARGVAISTQSILCLRRLVR
ncbi:hypothetical protein [Rhodopirellula bahusiensis]|uniref:Uncharacterized protein n=1 Tax=Rhodopirellula bahusiensis TaxID=2014065 RepID=A0A2G1VXZ4_9BACT|nr:hypothetical protein [Rhodopirellula bahusiensis]PHQ31615.1 hypothetical protein CEE69_30115 [Rhodopirellula bahusiensis]